MGRKCVMKREKQHNGKLKIAMYGHKRIPSREGGIEVVVGEIAPRMVKLGHEVTCFNRRGHHVSGKEHDMEQLTSYQGVQLKNVFTINRKGIAAVTSSFFGALYAAFGNYDVVHIHAEGPAAFCWIPKFLGKKIVVTIHGIDHQREKWRGGLGEKFIRFGEQCAVKYADEIIVLSKAVQDYFKRVYNRDTTYIPNGVNRPEIKEADLIHKKFDLEKDSYILFLGRLVPEKGIKYLIEAFKNVKTDKKLVIAGGSSDTDDFKTEIKELAAKDERIIFTGFIQGQMLEELYSNAYVYVLPSDLEGMPLTLLEAMSYGNCCLTSDIDECAGVTGEYGVTFQKGNAGELREKLQMLCDEETAVQNYKNRASDYICGKYNWDDVVNKTLSLYWRCEVPVESITCE